MVTVASQRDTTTPVPILKQINRVNDDGSYTYGFEAADGSFKVETRDKEGNVLGKYGYLDETGQVKTVEYTSGRVGHQARGEHLPEQPIVAPPTDDWEEPEPTTRRPRPASKQPKPAAVQQQQFQQPEPLPQRNVPALPVPALTAPVSRPVQQTHRLSAPAVQQTNQGNRGFSFSFEAPVLPPTPRPQQLRVNF